jgi:hypothetical protein
VNEARLQNAFQYVRQTFFPKWDRGGKWKVVANPSCSKSDDMGKEVGDVLALCCHVNKCIFVNEIPKAEDDLHALLIHEICHVKAMGHGKKWARNMNRAYIKAANNPNVSGDLADLIDCDIEEFYDEGLP